MAPVAHRSSRIDFLTEIWPAGGLWRASTSGTRANLSVRLRHGVPATRPLDAFGGRGMTTGLACTGSYLPFGGIGCVSNAVDWMKRGRNESWSEHWLDTEEGSFRELV